MRSGTDLLTPFVGPNGAVHTFNGSRFGSWAGEHVDVTPVVGLALIECNGDSALTNRIRDWVVNAQGEHGAWSSFWWSTDAYATAKNLEFLNSSGGVPADVMTAAFDWLQAQPAPRSSFEAANLLAALVFCELAEGSQSRRLIEWLTETRNADGSWPGSQVLLVPDQRNFSLERRAFADHKRLMSTAAVVQALELWQSRCKPD
jgi:hypothetical protein